MKGDKHMDFTTTKLLHGGDYNPEQWLDRPDILEKDVSMQCGQPGYFFMVNAGAGGRGIPF